MDANISLVFETIGQIKKSLQCSICLELLSDPHSTRCNHQFCSACIRKAVDERRNKQKEALCPLCKNPVTKRSLTANPRLKEIVDVVQRLNNAFKDDASIPDSPYPLINSRNNKQSQSENYLQFLRLHPTPQKPAKCNSSPSDSVSGKEHPVKSVQDNVHERAHLSFSALRKHSAIKTTKVNAGPRSKSAPSRDNGDEILSLLGLDDTGPEDAQRVPVGEDVSSNDENVETQETTLPGDSQADRSAIPQHGNTEILDTPESSMMEEVESSQSSALSCTSVSVLQALMLSESNDAPPAKIHSKERPDVVKDSLEPDCEQVLRCVNKEDVPATRNSRCAEVGSGILNPDRSPDDLKVNYLNAKSLGLGKADTHDSSMDDLTKTEVVQTMNKDAHISPVAFHRKQAADKDVVQQHSGGRVVRSMQSDSSGSSNDDGSVNEHVVEECSNKHDLRNIQSNSSVPVEDDQAVNKNFLPSSEQVAANLESKCPVPFDEDQLTNQDIMQEPSSERVLASLESNSGSYGVLPIPLMQEFISDDEVSFRLSSHSSKLDSSTVGVTCLKDKETDSPAGLQDDFDKVVRKRETLTAQIVCVQPRLSETSLQECNDSESVFRSPSSSSGSLNCTAAKRKNNEEPSSSRKWRRLNEKTSTRPQINVTKNNAAIMETLQVDFVENDLLTEVSVSDSQMMINKDKVLARSCPLDSATLTEEKSSNEKRIENLDLISEHKHVRTFENDTGDEIVPPTPPVRLNVAKTSPRKIGDIQGTSRQSQSATLQQPLFDGGVTENVLGNRASSLDRDNVSEVEDIIVNDEANSPVDNHPTSFQEDVLFNDDEPCDEGNVELLRRLAPVTAIQEESDESDEETSDCKTVDTTSVSSLTEGECADVSSQRIHYLQQVLAQTGGEIEKLTADLKTLRNSKANSEGDGKLVDEVDSEKHENTDERQSCYSLSPPPSLEPTAFTLTKLPSAIQDMQMLLQQNSDSEDERDLSQADQLSSARNVGKETFISRFPQTRSPSKTGSNMRQSERVNFPSDTVTITGNGKESSEKENDSFRQRHTSTQGKLSNLAGESTNRRSAQRTGGERCETVLAELTINPDPKPNLLTSNSSGAGVAIQDRLPSFGQPSVSFVVTRLPKQFVSLAGYLAKRNGGKLTADINSETTHVIMPTDSQMFASRKNYTIKYLLGIALGKWIVSQLWLTACVKSGSLVDEKPYEVKGDPEAGQAHVPSLARSTRETKGPVLFDGVSVICFGEFDGAISKVHICQLIQFCGGQVINSKQEASIKRVSDLVIIVDILISRQMGLLVQELCETYRTFPVSAEWVTDSVANYQLQDTEEYRVGV